MDIELSLKQSILDALKDLGLEVSLNDVIIDRSKAKEHGDYATNSALKFASRLGVKPFVLANSLKDKIVNENVDKIEIAGPGFINFFIKDSSLQSIVRKVIEEGDSYGQGQDKNFKINVEFVSANPTGPLHIGHARNAAYGDSLARILKKAGYTVSREYYVNDAGNQINNLALSIQARYKELLGEKITLTDDMYHGTDIIDIAQGFVDEYGDSLLTNEDALHIFKEKGMKIQLDRIKEDLAYFGIVFDTFSFETKIRENDAVLKEIKALGDNVYKEDNGALILRTTSYLDDKDRPIVKSNGDYTYFLPDICYHLDKLSRGYDLLIDVLGADHHGYINRMKSALMMHGYSKDALEVELIQMVRIFEDGKEMVLSKRTGKTLTLRELSEDTGVDAVRYFMVARDIKSHLDFNVNLAKEHSSSNPVYYAQYAYARLMSCLKSENEYGLDLDAKLLKEDSENALLKQIADFPNVVEDSALSKEPYIIANYVQKLASLVHGFYTECRVLQPDNVLLTRSRLALAKATAITIKNALDLIGVSAPEKM